MSSEMERTVEGATESVRDLISSLQTVGPALAEISNQLWEFRFERHVRNYLGRYLHEPRIVEIPDFDECIDAQMTEDEFEEVAQADIIVSGRPRRADLPSPVYVVIDSHDVERARRRTDLLKRAGHAAIPAVAGERTAEGLTEALREHDTVLMLGGKVERWDDAANAFLAAA